MKRKIFILVLFLIAGIFSAQVEGDSLSFKPQFRRGFNYSVLTSMGMVYAGYVTEETADFVTLENRGTAEKHEIRKSTIVETKLIRSSNALPESSHYPTNGHARQYLLSESAFLFEEGTLHMNSHWLLMEKFDYAITDHVAVTMSTIAFYPYSLGLKGVFRWHQDDYLGGSVFGIGDLTSGKKYSWFLGYGALARYTKGNENRNINLSAGFVGVNSDFFLNYQSGPFVNMLILNAAWCNRFRENVALNVEGWYLPARNLGLTGIGFKFIGDEITCWTLGCFVFMNGDENGLKLNFKTLPLPYFGISRKFD